MAIFGIETMNTDLSSQALGGTKSCSENTDKEDSFKVIFDEIKEKGLIKYAEEKRRQELREKILGEMGLSGEALKEMSPEKRMEIEQRISEEIMKRLAAENEINKGGDMTGGSQRQPFFSTSLFLTGQV